MRGYIVKLSSGLCDKDPEHAKRYTTPRQAWEAGVRYVNLHVPDTHDPGFNIVEVLE